MVSRTPAARHCCTAPWHPAREKMKTIAGSSPSRSRASTTANRGVGRPPPGRSAAGSRSPAAVARSAARLAHLLAVAASQQVREVRVDRRVDAGCGRVHVTGVQVEQVPAYQDVLAERDRPVLADHHRRVAAHGGQPVAELLRVGHGGGQRDQLDVVGEVDDHLLPDRPAEPVGEVVHLVHDDEPEALQGRRARVEHVAQDLGGHDDHGCVAVDRRVAREQADLVGAVAADQVRVLLVGERLDGRRVERLAARREREVDRELPDHGLARAGRRGDQHAAAPLERLARVDLEVVEREAQQLAELAELAAVDLGPAPGRGVALGR